MTHIYMYGLPKASQQRITYLCSYFHLLSHHSFPTSVRTSCTVSWWMWKCLPCILTLKLMLFLFKGEQVMFYSFLAETQELIDFSSSATAPFSTLSPSSFKNYPLRACQTWLSHTQPNKCLTLLMNWSVILLQAKFLLFFPLSSEHSMP